MVSIFLPGPTAVSRFLAIQQNLPFTYAEHFATKQPETIRGFDNDRLRVRIGQGARDFERAKTAVRRWRMFPDAWTHILPEQAPVQPGTTVAMYARFMGIWWRNACRVVYVVDEPNRFGFAYGTLPRHIQRSEELFHVTLEADRTVWYDMRAFSRPRHWMAKTAYPLMRLLQARFRRGSARQMRAFVQQSDRP